MYQHIINNYLFGGSIRYIQNGNNVTKVLDVLNTYINTQTALRYFHIILLYRHAINIWWVLNIIFYTKKGLVHLTVSKVVLKI